MYGYVGKGVRGWSIFSQMFFIIDIMKILFLLLKKKLVVDIIDNIVINVKKFVVDIFQKFENGYICLYWKYD